MLLILAVIGPIHILRGEVRLETCTDNSEGRLAPGITVPMEPVHTGPLTASRLCFDDSRWFAAFEQARDRTAVEVLRGVRPLVETDDDQDGEDRDESHEASEEAWYRHEFVGLQALNVPGEELEEVTDVEPGVTQDWLVVTTPEGDDVAVSFTEALVPAIDPKTGTTTLAPSGGSFPGHSQTEEAR